MPSKYTRKRKHDLDKDTTENADDHSHRDTDPSPAKKSSRKSEKKKDDTESMSIEETNKLRAELGLAPLEVDEPTDDQSENVAREDGGVLFKEDGMEIVHKAAKNLTEDKESIKAREKLALQKEKHKIYGKVLKAQKGLGESDSDEEGGVDNFLERMRAQAEKKAQVFDSLDQEAEQEAAQLAAKKAQQRKAREARKKKEDAYTSGLLVGHSKEDFIDGAETILVLQDKGVLDDDTEELLVNPNLVENERHKRNVEKRKQKSDYSAYDEETIDEFGMSKKKTILDKYDDLDNEGQRETFRLDAAGGYDLDREQQELDTKRRLMMANKKFESLETPKYIQAREFYTEEEMLTFRKPKKKKDKIRKTRALKAADFENVQEETSAEKLEKAKRLAARRRNRGESMEVDEEAPKNGSSKEEKPKKSVGDKDMEEGEVLETEQVNEVGAPQVSKWKHATGASVDLSRIRSFAAKFDTKEEEEESDEEEDLFQGVNLTGVVIDDEAEDELYGALAQSRKLKQIKEETVEENRAKYVRQALSSHGVIKEEPGDSDAEMEATKPSAYADGIIIDATSEQYKLIGDSSTVALAGNRNDDVDYSELLAEHKRIAAEQKMREHNREQRKHSDDEEDLSDVESNIKTEKLKRRRGKDSDMEVDSEEDEKKPVWKAIGDDESTSSKHASKRNYRKSTHSRQNEDSDDEVYGDDYKNVLGEERDVTKGVGAMLRLAAEKGYLDNANRGNSGGALKHLESKRFSRVDQGKMDIEDKYIRKLERMGTTGSGPIRPFAEKSDYKPAVEITYTDKQGRPIEEKEAFRELSHKFHGKGSGKKKIEKRQAKLKKQERMKQMNSSDTPLGTLQKQLKKQEQLQSAFIILSGSNRSDLGSQLQKD